MSIRHLARGRQTLCGIELGRSIPDPEFEPEGVTDCKRPECTAARKATTA